MQENVKGQNDNQQQTSGNRDTTENASTENSSNTKRTSDTDEQVLTTGSRTPVHTGSGISTKTGVTGSDFDGQVVSE
jgi:hypothetical protein